MISICKLLKALQQRRNIWIL